MDTPEVSFNNDNIAFLENLANRISTALYYGTHESIGLNGSVSPGLLHDDYDRLRTIAKGMRIKVLQEALQAEGNK